MNKLALLFIVTAVICLGVPATSQADTDSLIFDKIEQVSDWFWHLADKYDAIVKKEEQKQFIRKVDRLRKELYSLEQASLNFLQIIPVDAPNSAEQEALYKGLDELESLLKRVISSLNEIGANIRQADQEAEGWTYQAIQSRGIFIRSARNDLKEAIKNPESWDGHDVIKRLERAIAMLNRAQRKVSDFQSKYR